MHKHTANAAQKKGMQKRRKTNDEEEREKKQIKTRMSVLKIFQAKEKREKSRSICAIYWRDITLIA